MTRSSTAQHSDRQLVSPGKRPITLVRLRTPGAPDATFLWIPDQPELNSQTRRKLLETSDPFDESPPIGLALGGYLSIRLSSSPSFHSSIRRRSRASVRTTTPPRSAPRRDAMARSTSRLQTGQEAPLLLVVVDLLDVA